MKQTSRNILISGAVTMMEMVRKMHSVVSSGFEVIALLDIMFINAE